MSITASSMNHRERGGAWVESRWVQNTIIALIVFNLIPLYPLDGHHVVRELLPRRHQHGFMHFQQRAGIFILGALVFGPWLLQNILRVSVISPIGWLLSRIVFPLLEVSFPGRSWFFVRETWIAFLPYLPW